MKIMDISELQSLPIDQKIEIIGQLWNDIDDADAPLNLSPAVFAEIERRRAKHAENPSATVDRSELWRRVDAVRRKDG